MCTTCGCDHKADVKYAVPGRESEHKHHHGPSGEEETLILEKDILHENNLFAERNRGYLEAKNLFALNLVSSPGSGKTSLLEATIKALKDEFSIYVIEGDQQTSHDAERIQALDVPVIQINTGKGCHLDAHMVHHALKDLNPEPNGILFIENVGNLVCPAMFDLGEAQRVVIMSVTEGEDKPIKYPDMFASSQVCVVNKIDLLPYLSFDVEKAKSYGVQVNPHLEFFELSACNGDGLPVWLEWLRSWTLQPA
jgi:hydrogenase nickel incorporation protein HypB